MLQETHPGLFTQPVTDWFDDAFPGPTEVQLAAWPAIAERRNVLVAAPTGSGKTLTAFLCSVNDLLLQSRQAPLPDQVHVLYVSPLKALSNDIDRNLQAPLEGIEAILAKDGQPPSGIRTAVRTGDTTPGEREKMKRSPPHILVTTPESLYLLLTSDSGRAMLSQVRTVIVDEIHAVAGNKRGSHLALSLARLDALCLEAPVRIGLSATQKPLERIADFLSPTRPCVVVDEGHRRAMDIHIELPGSPLTAVMPNEVWTEIYDRLEALIEAHGTTLIFVNTRRLTERLTRHLAERLGEEQVAAHHGSLSRKHRFAAEQSLKAGRLKALVATASLELGIDIGSVDLVCQLGSPGSIAALLQRVGRSGHQVGATPKGRLFPLSRDDLVECVALQLAVNAGELDTLRIPGAPLDVLAQQLVAEVSAREWQTDALYQMVRSAWPYRALPRDRFDAVLGMLTEGYATRRGRRSAWLFHDSINQQVRPRPAARLTALQNGGAIPDHFDYDVVLLPEGHRIGSLNEDFAFESLPGDIFQLGNTSYRIAKVEQGRVLVEDAHGQPPNIPFWIGDAPGRSDELSDSVSRLRANLEAQFKSQNAEGAREALLAAGIAPLAVTQLVDYLHAAWQALSCLPTRHKIVMERFFDDTGDMHLVVHAPLGSRLMRAWGLALRKRFCRQFNFELQASALDDSLILSLGETHSFELPDVMTYLNPESCEEVLIQALLDAPMFGMRWRWSATTALAVQRMRNGRKLPPQWQRNQAEDLVAVVFPDQLACLENLSGAREVPDHPLVAQTLDDCLHESMDADGLRRLLVEISDGRVEVVFADLTGPSPLSREIINARPYAFLDDGEAENRRTRAIRQEPDDLGSAETLSIISVEATEQVRAEAWITPRNADELHDGLLQLGFLTRTEFSSGNASTGAAGNASQWPAWFGVLTDDLRACCARLPDGSRWWVATERLHEWCAVHPDSQLEPDPTASWQSPHSVSRDDALTALMRDRMAGLGPVTIGGLCRDFALDAQTVEQAMRMLQGEGFAIRMGSGGDSWCERRLLARIHRYSRQQRRRAVRTVSAAAFARFLFRWHQLDAPGQDLEQALSLLEGWAAPVAAWEQFLLRSRWSEDSPQILDACFLSGSLAWFRPQLETPGGRQVIAASPVALVPRSDLDLWRSGRSPAVDAISELQGHAERVYRVLERLGALFTPDLQRETGLLGPHLEAGLKELVYQGLVTADAFSPLRWLLRPERGRVIHRRRGLRRAALPVGRWSLLPAVTGSRTERRGGDDATRLAGICRSLLKRYGVVFRAVLQRESLIPPWREILPELRRMEDRGEVHGGRFVDGFSGEQFALPEALGLLRNAGTGAQDALRVIHASDPLNLGGLIWPGPTTPAQQGNRILLENGLPVARMLGDEIEIFDSAGPQVRNRAPELLRVVTAWKGRHVR